jgi:hypothetical protein
MLPNAHTKDKWQKGDCKKNKCTKISQEKKITEKNYRRKLQNTKKYKNSITLFQNHTWTNNPGEIGVWLYNIFPRVQLFLMGK